MNAKHLIAALLSTALLAGCNDAGPLAPADDIDPPHPPIGIEDPVKPLPPIEGGANDRGGNRSQSADKLDPVYPMPPIEEGPPNEERPGDPPVKPLPPPVDWDEDSHNAGGKGHS